MNQYTEPLSLTSQVFFCGLPLRLDSYLGCQFQCKFCFALNRGGVTYWDKVRPADPKFVHRRLNYVSRREPEDLGLVSQFIKARVPIHFGGMSDPFQKLEEKHAVSKAYLDSLSRFNYPTVVSTRSELPSKGDYLSILRHFPNVVLQFSFSTLDDRRSSLIEPNSPSPSIRMAAMERLSSAGVNVTARWQPFIVGFSEDPSMFVSRIVSTGVKHLGIEHLKIPLAGSSHRAPWPSHVSALGVDLNETYKKLNAKASGREIILPIEAKVNTIIRVKEALNHTSVSFGCADNEFQYLSDTKCCCSGVDQFPGFGSWYKYQIGNAIRKSTKKKEIRYSSISREWRPAGSIKEFMNSHSRTDGPDTLEDHLLRRWNSSDVRQNLTSFYNIRDTGTLDSTGNKIYTWNNPQP